MINISISRATNSPSLVFCVCLSERPIYVPPTTRSDTGDTQGAETDVWDTETETETKKRVHFKWVIPDTEQVPQPWAAPTPSSSPSPTRSSTSSSVPFLPSRVLSLKSARALIQLCCEGSNSGCTYFNPHCLQVLFRIGESHLFFHAFGCPLCQNSVSCGVYCHRLTG